MAVNEAVHEIEVEIRNAEGLHMRPAMQFVDLAGSFKSDISVSKEMTTADAKSIMHMTMWRPPVSKLRVRAKGRDAQAL